MAPPLGMRDLSYRRRGKKFKSPVHDSQSQAERRTETPFSKSTENWELYVRILATFPRLHHLRKWMRKNLGHRGCEIHLKLEIDYGNHDET
jgi:hypothetical protein